MTTETFLVDDFFASDNDPGVVIPVTIKGRIVPITIKRGMSLEERNACEARAIKQHIDPAGRLINDGMDMDVLTRELVFRAILDWPFTQKDGSKLPVTREAVNKLLGGAEAIAMAMQTIDQQGEAALVPFVPASDAA